MSSIFDWEERRLGMRDTLKHGTLTVSGFGYFHKNCRFPWEKTMFQRQNLGSTIHYTYTSYNKYSRLCMVSEELRLNEISLFRYCDVYRVRNLLNRIHTRRMFASMSQITGSLFYYTEIQKRLSILI